MLRAVSFYDVTYGCAYTCLYNEDTMHDIIDHAIIQAGPDEEIEILTVCGEVEVKIDLDRNIKWF